MCLLIAKRPEAFIPDAHLLQGFDQNPDGAGLAYLAGGKVQIEKGFGTAAAFLDAYRRVNPDAPHLVHFRWATHGPVCVENCHPFRLPHGMAMGHNGMIPVAARDGLSDTRMFVNDVLAPDLHRFGAELLDNASYRAGVERMIGASKLAFLDRSGRLVIYNEGRGHWAQGVWYSNESYRPDPLDDLDVLDALEAADAARDAADPYGFADDLDGVDRDREAELEALEATWAGFTKGDDEPFAPFTRRGGARSLGRTRSRR